MENKIVIELSPFDDESVIEKKTAKKSGMRAGSFKIKIDKKSIDARHKKDIRIVYALTVYDGVLEREKRTFERINTDERVAVIGAGPAGLFAALTLARHGIKPVVFERGESVDERSKTVKKFFAGGGLNVASNVQFGEGGAGAFSDGKLNTQVNNRLIGEVIEDFVAFGAPKDIAYSAKPHVGSDRLPGVVKAIRGEIKKLGGVFFFNEKASLLIDDGKVKGVKTSDGKAYDFRKVVLAVGHSARDTFEELYRQGVYMEQKEFAMGFRIEQLQSVIDKDRYGDFAGVKTLPPADYKLVSHPSERGVFTFCMCPGGYVVPAASEEGGLVVNGMSNYARDGVNANSAVVCQTLKSDFFGDGPLDGIKLQRSIERKAFEAFGNYTVPVQLASDFIAGKKTKSLEGVIPTYSRGYDFCSLERLLPETLVENLKAGLKDMDGKIKGFASCGAVLSAAETRTSSPVRITRNEKFESVNVEGLYPCGEGCGYAGGITSAAADGIKCAEACFAALRDEI